MTITKEPVARLITLGVGTKGEEDYAQVYQDLSELAKSLGEVHGYVCVSSAKLDEDSEEEAIEFSSPEEHVCCDADTLLKVLNILTKVMVEKFNVEENSAHDAAEAMINECQNAGILFRERVL